MEITSINIRKIEKEGSRMKGIASVVLDDAFAIHDIRIIEGDNGLFIAMPSRKTKTGGYRDIAHPINQETRASFEEKILEAFDNYVEPEPVVKTEEVVEEETKEVAEEEKEEVDKEEAEKEEE